MHAAGLWLEITTLVIPGQNDSEEELRSIAGFIAGLDPGIPWHVSRFHPTYRMTRVPATPAETLFRAAEIGREEGLHYIYAGNIPGLGGEDTLCPGCEAVLIERTGFHVRRNRVANARCPDCGTKIAGVFED
jgi:pyruvate formate lyase activating enzyme